MNREPNAINLGKVVSVRGSVVDIQFDEHLPPITSLGIAVAAGFLLSRMLSGR